MCGASQKLHDLLEKVPPKVANDTRFADKDANSDGVAMSFEAKEVKQKNSFWRRLLERVSCFGYNQRYEDKDSRVIFNIDNEVKYLVDEKMQYHHRHHQNQQRYNHHQQQLLLTRT